MNTASPIEDVARLHGRALRALAGRLTHDPHDASDLLQDAFERAVRCSRDQGPEELRRWIVSVMHNLFIDQCRRRAANRRALVAMHLAQERIPLAEEDTTPTWAGVTPEKVAAVLESLEPDFRRVLELRENGASLSQIASELGIPRSTVGTRLFRARRKLRALLLASR